MTTNQFLRVMREALVSQETGLVPGGLILTDHNGNPREFGVIVDRLEGNTQTLAWLEVRINEALRQGG